jgi:tRNA C32,U32 (ribose-2'-O)-methylase TrmJ
LRCTDRQRRGGPLADAAAVAGMLQHLEQALVAIDFLDPAAPKKLMPRLNQLFNRAHPPKKKSTSCAVLPRPCCRPLSRRSARLFARARYMPPETG